MKELDGKVAIVTGAGRLRGIGRSAALALAKLGADVVVTGTGRNPDSFPDDEKAVNWRDIESSAEQIREQGTRALPVIANVSSLKDVQSLVDKTLDEFGRIDILVNNAAFARGPDRVPLLELDPKIFQKVLDVKINGTFYCSKLVAKIMIDQAQGGKIVNVSSGAGKSGSAQNLSYNAACFAQIGMTQSLARELGPYGVNVNCVCPGAVDTSRVDDVSQTDEWDKIAKSLPIGRTGTDEEVGGFIAYLCTNDASWIHGQSINLDGGGMMEH